MYLPRHIAWSEYRGKYLEDSASLSLTSYTPDDDSVCFDFPILITICIIKVVPQLTQLLTMGNDRTKKYFDIRGGGGHGVTII
jgi:hypothetical protein